MTSHTCATIRPVIEQIVASIDPLDDLESEQKQFVRDWVQSAKEIFRLVKPATPDTHLVSYFAVVSPHEKKILLVDHRQAKLWLPPGGHVELNEHPKDTVKREVREELGVDANFLLESPLFVTISKTSGARTGIGHTDVSLWYVLRGYSYQQFDYDKKEFKQIRWFGIDEIPYAKSDPHMKRFMMKLQKYHIF